MSAKQQAKKILHQLDNCDMIANHWAKELLTIFEPTCVKEWQENQHLKVQAGKLFIVELRLHRRPEKPIYSLIISSSKDILFKDASTYAPDTLILIGSATTDKCTLVWWDEKDNTELFFTLDKNNGQMNRFILTNDKGSYAWDYLQFKNTSNNLIDNRLRLKHFRDDNLACQSIKKTRSKGARNSNQNSEVQSARKKHKPVKNSTVVMEWENRTEKKTIKDAHIIVSGNYGYTKSYQTFRRALDASKTSKKPIAFKNDSDILQVSID